MKFNYPVEYFTTLLNSEAGKSGEKFVYIMLELSRLKIKLLASDINFSEVDFSVQKYNGEYCIRGGLFNIKNIGTELSKYIILERKKNGIYKSIIDFFTRMDDKLINKRQVEYFSMAGVFDSLKVKRSVVFNSVSSLLAISQKSQQERETNQQNLFGSDLNNKNESVILNDQVSWNKTECLMNEYYSLGYFISINPPKSVIFVFCVFPKFDSLRNYFFCF